MFNGIGPNTAGIFLRELRGLWPKADPPLSDLAKLAAVHLGIEDPPHYWKRHALPGYEYRHFETALARLGKDCRRTDAKSRPSRTDTPVRPTSP